MIDLPACRWGNLAWYPDPRVPPTTERFLYAPMFHIGQIQVNQPRFVLMAALVLTSLPTLLVFMFTQRIIMRGIILPSYK